MMNPKLHYLLKVAISFTLLLSKTSFHPILANDLSEPPLSTLLETALNKNNFSLIKNILTKQDELSLKSQYDYFIVKFPNAKWNFKEEESLLDGRRSLTVLISGDRQLKNEKYSIKAKQNYAIKYYQGKIISLELMSEETILQKSDQPISIEVKVPETVLTGTLYDFDIIIDKPLGNTIIAAGLTNITTDQIKNQISPEINLTPLGSGGLFKIVRAPLKDGMQNWAALIVHPTGMVSVTKRVKIVSTNGAI